MEPELGGKELSPGDCIEDAIPTCHGEDMDRSRDGKPALTYTCGECGSVVKVDRDGLVWDILDPEA